MNAEKVGHLLVPERLRPYVTFRLMTIFVAVLAIWNMAFSIFMKPQLSGFDGQVRSGHRLFHSPFFLVLYNIGIAIGFWVIYTKRGNPESYQLRVLCYGILLGRVGGEALALLL